MESYQRTRPHKDNIVSTVCPPVPEVLQGFNKVWLLCVYPGHFIEKHYFFSVSWKITKMFLQRIKGIKPVGILWYSLQPCILLHCFSKIAQLNPLRGTMWAHEAGMEHSLSLAISFCSILISIICWKGTNNYWEYSIVRHIFAPKHKNIFIIGAKWS